MVAGSGGVGESGPLCQPTERSGRRREAGIWLAGPAPRMVRSRNWAPRAAGTTRRAMAGYILDQTWVREAERLGALERCGDPLTVDHLCRAGVGAGWRCLEVGAGRGSIARWLADRVGDLGAVMAIDLDTTLLEQHPHPNLEVRRLDILSDPLPGEAFHLVPARH